MKEFIFQNFYLIFFASCSLFSLVFEGIRHPLKLTRTQWLCYSLGIVPTIIAALLGSYALSEPLQISSITNYFLLGLMFFFPFLILMLIAIGFLVFAKKKSHEKKIICLYLLTFACGYAVYIFIWVGVGFGSRAFE